MAASMRVLLRSGVMRQITRHRQQWPTIGSQHSRLLSVSLRLRASEEEFKQAKERLNSLQNDPGNEAKLKLYALFKQASVGKVNISRPGMMDFVGRAKWDAWDTLGDMSQEEARSGYVAYIDELVGSEPAASKSTSDTDSSTTSEDVLLIKEGKLAIIKLNRPDKFNALKFEMYNEIRKHLENVAQDDSITLAVMTGAGKFYCSGNDLSNFSNINPADMSKVANEGHDVLKAFVAGFIDFPKPLIGIVNGPAVGVSVTTLGLFDAVYATDRATFNTPFTVLGQSAEGCSSYLFPKIMGESKAKAMLLFNQMLTADQACAQGLVTEVFPDHVFQDEIWKRVREYAKLPKDSLRLSKCLVREVDKEALHATNARECKLLVERWQSTECIQAIMDFFSRKK